MIEQNLKQLTDAALILQAYVNRQLSQKETPTRGSGLKPEHANRPGGSSYGEV